MEQRLSGSRGGRDLFIAIKTRKRGTPVKKLIQVPLHPVLLEHLKKISSVQHKPDSMICPVLSKRCSTALSNDFMDILKRAGIDSGNVVRVKGIRAFSRLRYHAFRHTFSTGLFKQGVPEATRMILTGHSTTASHRKYAHPEMQIFRSAISLLPSIKLP